MANKVSVLIPSRAEKYVVPTIDECFTKAEGDVEVVVTLQDKVPDDWNQVIAKYPKLTTVYHHEAKGMRRAINDAAASAISRGAKWLLKLDAHCMLDEGWDTKLLANIEPNWVVVPRRKRLDVENWKVRDDGRADIDYHFLSFPDNVQDFGGPGLNGRPWAERAKERFNKPEFDIDDEMSSQGSGWFTSVENFQRLELMDEASYGPFWNEMQEIGLKAWLSGGKLMVNKKTWYAHWHKGSAGRGYHLPREWQNQGARHSKRWMFNEAWPKQTIPFKWLIQHFWPVPTWPENWEELVYAGPNRSKIALPSQAKEVTTDGEKAGAETPSLRVISAFYGPTGTELDVKAVLESKIANDSLDLNVTNGELQVGNPFRGVKKLLTVTYSYDNQQPTTITKEEREWLIIGQSARWVKGAAANFIQVEPLEPLPPSTLTTTADIPIIKPDTGKESYTATSFVKPAPAALNDYLIRKFQIPSHRLRGPMPIELRDFHRDDLAKLFAELGFNRGVEIGVAEGKYSEVLVKANPELELLCVDPWHAYSGNPQNKSKEKNEYAFNEAKRRLEGFNVKFDMRYSMDAVRDVTDGSLDFVYVDAHHSYPFVMSDLIFWSQKVRSGGIVAGDDAYRLNEKWGAGPMEAIYDYTRAMKIEPWFLINAHKSVDFFFIKP